MVYDPFEPRDENFAKIRNKRDASEEEETKQLCAINACQRKFIIKKIVPTYFTII